MGVDRHKLIDLPEGQVSAILVLDQTLFSTVHTSNSLALVSNLGGLFGVQGAPTLLVHCIWNYRYKDTIISAMLGAYRSQNTVLNNRQKP